MHTGSNMSSSSLLGKNLRKVRHAVAALPGADILRVRFFLSLLLVWVLVFQTLVPLQVRQVRANPPSESTAGSQDLRLNDGGWFSRIVKAFSPASVPLPATPPTAPGTPPPDTLTDAVISRQHPNLNRGRIEGTLRVLTGQSFAFNGSTLITSDLFLPGTPSVTLNGGAQHGGIVNDGGSATPNNYTLSLNGGVQLAGSIHTRVDPVQLPAEFPASVPAAGGTRTVTVQSQAGVANIGNWQTLRDLNVNGANITIDVPPGNYRTFTVNGNSRLKFTAGTYNFANTFTLDGSASLQATGHVDINVAQNLTVTSGSLVLGSYTAPGDVRLNVLGSLLNVNGSSQVSGLIRAYNGTVTLNGTTQVRGQVIANVFTLNGGKLIGAVWPVQTSTCSSVFGPRRYDRTTGPPNQYVDQFSLPAGFPSPFTLHIQNGAVNGSSRVSSATVKLNGVDIVTPSDLNQNVASLDRTVTLTANNQLDVKLQSSPGSYLIINLCGAPAVTDTTPPVVAITSPANNSTTTDSQISVTGTATDTGAGASGVAHVYVNNVEAAYNSADATWILSNVSLALGSNQIIARAVDQAGNEATAGITVTRESPANHAPTAAAGPDQTLTLPQTASLHGTASDDGLPTGSTLTTNWTKVSGPGTVTFVDSHALETTASFSTDGTYVLRLTANDSQLSTLDDITITVEPANQPPTANAGPDQTIALPNTATLNGAVSDDGLPAGGSLTSIWSKLSGPGSVVFEDPAQTNTVASFTEPGTYVLSLTGSDTELSSGAAVTITVQPENHAPTVNAGPDQIISLPSGAQLNGAASDDGWPAGSSLTTLWTMVSGPAPVVFDNPNVTVTAANFSVAGPYVLRLTASDGDLSNFDDVTINVTPPNQPPRVNAGADQIISLPINTVSLSGAAVDDGLPLGSSVAVAWSKVSGPGTVTFGSSNQLSTTAQFAAADDYVLRLTATDGQLTTFDELSVKVHPLNQTPMVNAGPDQTVTAARQVLFFDDFESGSGKWMDPGSMVIANVSAYPGSHSQTFGRVWGAGDARSIFIPVIPGQTYNLRGSYMTQGGGGFFGFENFDASQQYVSHTWMFGDGSDGGVLTTAWSYYNINNTPASELDRWRVYDHPYVVPAGIYYLRIITEDWSGGLPNDPLNHGVFFDNIELSTYATPQVTLSGTASDVGLPTGSTLVTVWSKVSGPGTVAIGNPNQLVTTAAFDMPGVYVLRLTATDSVLTSLDEIVVTIRPANHAPQVNAGGDHTITMAENPLTLNGVVTDDGLPAGAQLTANWGVVGAAGVLALGPLSDDFNDNSFDLLKWGTVEINGTGAQLVERNQRLEFQPSSTAFSNATFRSNGYGDARGKTISFKHGPISAGQTSRFTVRDDGAATTIWANISETSIQFNSDSYFDAASRTDGSFAFDGSSAIWLRWRQAGSQFFWDTSTDGINWTSRVTANLYRPATSNQYVKFTFNSPAGLPVISVDDFTSNIPTLNRMTGPGTVAFSNPNRAATTASFSGAGVYTLRLEGSDSELTNLDDIVVTVNPGNQPPTVSAGPNQTVFFPNAVNLDAFVYDDGFPVGSTVTQTWSKVSGPGSVTFASPGTTATSATFTTTGTYVLRLTASDSELSGSGDVQVIVAAVPVNQPPTVNAGVDQTITLPCVANLQGTATDDGLPAGSTLSISWSKVSGPGSVSFSNPSAAITTATFNLAGNYVLRLSGSDSQLVSNDDLAVVVNPIGGAAAHYFPPTPYLSFLDSPFNGPSFNYFYLEDFEDHLLNTPGVTSPNGGVTSVVFGPSIHDSVDGDDGVIDGSGLGGDSFFREPGSLEFTFDANVLGSLPTHAGVVWTDGAGDVYFEAFDRNGASMGRQGPFDFPDFVYNGTTAEDRFMGAYNPDGISAIRVFNTGGGIEIDHLQYGFSADNLAPIVNAGPDQSVVSPVTSVTLNGAVSDDGLPACSTVTVSWSVLSGPGAVTFTNANALNTTATFSGAGSYVLRLTASDSQLTTTDEVAVTVSASNANQPPTANAGPDQTVTLHGNLIFNPGNEQPLANGEIPSWTEVQGTNWTTGSAATANGFPSAQRGNAYFFASDAPQAELRQDIDLSAYAGTIAGGTQQFEFQAYVRSAAETVPDAARVIIEYRNAANTSVVATLDSGPITSTTAWHLTEDTRPAPVGTGWIRVRLVATRNSGTTNDAFFDSVSLRPLGNVAVKLNGAVTDDGLPTGSSVSASWTKVSGPGNVTFANANAASASASFTIAGAYVLRLTASDGQLSAGDDVTITVNPPNQAPVVNPGTNQTINLPAAANLNGTATDDGLPTGSSLSVTWSKLNGPGNVSFVNANSSTTTATFSAAGVYVLRLTADDSEEANSSDVTISVGTTTGNQPPAVNAGVDQGIQLPVNTVTINGTATDDGSPVGGTLVVAWSAVSGPAAVVFGNANSAVTTAQFSVTGAYVLRLTAGDGELTNSDDVVINVTPASAQNQPPTANAGPDQTALVSQGAQLDGSASDDGLPAGSNLTTNWTKVSGPGTVTFLNPNVTITGAQFSATGTYVLRLTASDGSLSASDDVTITVIDDVAPPTVEIITPTDGSSVTEPTLVTGSVSSGAWVLEYSLDSDDNQNSRVWTTFATGNGQVTNGTLGTLDPTMMLNGLFDIRLSATDTYGQTSRTWVAVVVERNLKVGNFTVSFSDLNIPVAGVPMEVTRTYDSRDKRVGDFGFGWTLGLKNIRVEKARVIGFKWYETRANDFAGTYCLEPTGSHLVTVTFPGGKVFKFEAATSPHCQGFSEITGGTLTFRPLPGTHGTLEIVGSSAFTVEGSKPGPVNLVGIDGGVDIFNSSLFKYTAEDGTAFVIDQRAGLQSIQDTNNNTVTVSAGGIVHSNGKSITFNRDSLGRITSVVDPAGNAQTYTYDAAGDLVSYTDNENNTSIYTYDVTHRLLTIHDPRGIQPIRNDYDADGRLISHTDGFGKVITYLHDLPGRTETITDRLGHGTVLQYDERGNVLTRTDARGGVTTFTYDANDNVLSETNALGKTTTNVYDANDRRVSVTDPLGNTTQFTYNGLGKVLTTTDPLGHVTTNAYNGVGNLLTTKDALNNITTYAYSVIDGQRISVTDALNNTTRYEYTGGSLTKEIDALGNEATFIHDANGNSSGLAVKRTNAQGQIETIATTFEYDKLNRLTKTILSDGSSTRVEYNSLGKQAATIDQLGARTEFTYDEMARLIRVDYPDGTHEEMTYDAEGRRLTSKDRAGRVSMSDYDERGRVVKTTYPDGIFTRTAYDAIDRISSTTDARGNLTAYEYDPNCGCSERRSKITDPLGHVTLFTYDGNGNQTSTTDALGHTTTFEYDAKNRRMKTVYADNTFDALSYDLVGHVLSRTDQAGKITQSFYDGLGRLVKVKDALNQETTYGYDELGHLTSQTDANQHTTRFEYDGVGRRVKRILPGGQSEIFSYGQGGILQSRIDFNGKTTAFTYDVNGRVLTKTPDPSLNEPAISFTYNALGLRATMNDASGTTVYAYDGRNHLTRKQTSFGALDYTYDEAGDLLTTRSSHVNGLSVDYSYDLANRLATVKDNNLLALNGGITSYSYDPAGNLQGYVYPNGVTTSFAYNSLNRLTTMTVGTSGSALASYFYSLDGAGHRTAVTELSGRTVTYTYDNLYRLTSESITNDAHAVDGSISYNYDPVGNRLARMSSVVGVPSQGLTYDANDRLNSDSYDNNGNTTTAGGSGYAYDFENHLTSLNSGVVRYVYDGDGNRVAKTVGGLTTNYMVDSNNLTGHAQVAEEIQGGSVVKSFTYGHNLISQRIISGSVSFYQQDGHASVRLLTDGSGSVTDTYDYDAFGNLIYHAGTTPNDYLYSGEQFDSSAGFYYLRARYLSPENGRFWSMDSYEGSGSDPSSLHKYLYAENDPVNRLDPSGRMSISETVMVGVVAGIVASIAAFVTFASLNAHYLPKDAFTKLPDAGVMGFQETYPIGRVVRGVSNTPFALGLSLGLIFSAGFAGVDLVFPYGRPTTAWAYAFAGVSVGPGVVLDGRSLTGYAGFVWNVSSAVHYAGPFFCASVTPGSIAFPGFASRAGTLCTSPPKDDGSPGAYSVTVSATQIARSAQTSGSIYRYLGDAGTAFHPPDPASAGGDIDSLLNAWHNVSNELWPEQ